MAAKARLRPRIRRISPLEIADIRQRIEARLSDRGSPATGRLFSGSAVLKVPPEERHFWSPHLEIGFEPLPEGGTELRGIFGPRPAIWSIFVAAYAAIGFLGVMGVTFGVSQWILGNYPWALWSGPAALCSAIVVYGVARFGRHLGHDQMVLLASWVDEVAQAGPVD